MDLKNSDIPRAAAHDYVSMSQSFLEQGLGRECEMKELAEFSETAGSTFLGSMYALLREKEGKETAEAWLKKAMASMSSTARLAGADALIKVEITIKDMPNRLPKREELGQPTAETKAPAPAPVAAQAPQKCECKVEDDQSCLICLRVMSVAMGHAFKGTIDMLGIATKLATFCGVCKVKHGDEAISKIVPDMIKAVKDKKAVVEQVTVIALQLGGTLGVQAMPITQAALKEGLEGQEE